MKNFFKKTPNDTVPSDVIDGEFFTDAQGNMREERRIVPRTASGAIIMPAPTPPQ